MFAQSDANALFSLQILYFHCKNGAKHTREEREFNIVSGSMANVEANGVFALLIKNALTRQLRSLVREF